MHGPLPRMNFTAERTKADKENFTPEEWEAIRTKFPCYIWNYQNDKLIVFHNDY